MPLIFTSFLALVLLWARFIRSGYTRPHILLILVDDLGWSDVGYHNISSLKTPNIDRLATEGVILENYYVLSICTPTRAALLSGRYPIHTGMQKGVVGDAEPYGLPLNITLLPQKLKDAGYSTHMVGKWHLGHYEWEYTPTYRGFDTFYGFYNGAEDHWTHERDGILDLRDQTAPAANRTNEYSANIFSERAIQIITNADSTTPMFLYLSFQLVHDPAQAPDRFVNMYTHLLAKTRRTYAGMVSALDEAVGNVTDALKRKGVWNDTLTIFTTDNGGIPLYGGYNWPLRGCKTTLWEGGVRGAGFVHGEMLKSKGRRCRELLHVTDWYPTILGLAGFNNISISPTLDGHDIWDTLSYGAPSPRWEVLLNIDPPEENTSELGARKTPVFPIQGEGMALRSGDMKLMLNVTRFEWYKPPEMGGEEVTEERLISFAEERIDVALYNITADPEERHDLSAAYPDVVARLRERVDFYIKRTLPSGKRPPESEAYETAKTNRIWGPWRSSNKKEEV